MLANIVLVVGKVTHIDGDKFMTSSGGRRDTYNLRYYRPYDDPFDGWARRLPPDKGETCQNLLLLAQMTQLAKARTAYEKQYAAMAPRHAARKGVEMRG